jgi:hypothetical protein
MKKLLFIGLIAATTVAFTSCKKEGCTDSTAVNFSEEAKKDDGSCTYPAPDPRDAYIGNYWVTDSTWLAGPFYEVQTYALNISTGGTASDTIYLNNLWNDGANYIAVMAGGNFSIPLQQVSGPYYATGSGNFQNDIITYETSGDVYVNEGSGPKQ